MNTNRGYFSIGIINPQKPENLGTLWRAAHNFGASFIYTIGRRYKIQASDTTAAYRSIPLFEYQDFEEFYEKLPKDCRLVGVELDEQAIPIKKYSHLERCCYLLGSESSGIPKRVLEKCHSIVQLPGKYCQNVSICGAIVMFDRLNKS